MSDPVSLSADLEQLAAERPDAPRLSPKDQARLEAALAFEESALPEGAWERLEASLRAEDEAPRVSLSCTYCHDALERSGGQAAAYCASCLAPHHLDCFQDHARCSAPGCGETRWVLPQESGAPAPVDAGAEGKPELRVLEREASDPPPRRRRVLAWAGAAAVALLGLGVAALNSDLRYWDRPIATTSGNGTFLVYAETIPAGTILTPDHVTKREVHVETVRKLEEREGAAITETRLSSFLGQRLNRRVLKGEFLWARQFRAPQDLPEGATIETYVFTHDVQAGEVLREGDFERRQVAWRTIWEAPDQRLVHDAALAFVGQRLIARGRGGEPLRFTHFEAGVSTKDEWKPTQAERDLALSELGQNLIRLARPVERARAYLHHHGMAEGIDLDAVEVSSYCPPQPTVYSWLVTFRTPKGEPLYIAVSEAGRTWQLDDAFEVVRADEYAKKGGLLPR